MAVDITPDSAHSDVRRLWGFSIYEDAGAAARITLRDSTAGGQVLFHVALAANESASLILPRSEAIDVGGAGVYVEEAAGSIVGVLHGDAQS